MSRKNTVADFWLKVYKTEGCWLWTEGTRGRMQYGAFKYQGRTEASHRFAYKLVNGGIPSGMQVLHKCDNPKCVNPTHLFLGTNIDNVRDKLAKGRGGSYTNAAKGEDAGQSKLTDVIVKAIRTQYATGNYTQAEIAKEYGVDQSVVSRLLHNKTWRHIA